MNTITHASFLAIRFADLPGGSALKLLSAVKTRLPAEHECPLCSEQIAPGDLAVIDTWYDTGNIETSVCHFMCPSLADEGDRLSYLRAVAEHLDEDSFIEFENCEEPVEA